jgi:tRNA pseudouridine38-40 synthase
VKTLHRLDVDAQGDLVRFSLTADAFLHHMVRNLIGCLVQVGKGAQPPGWAAEVLASRDRARAAPTFGPEGLYLTAVTYPERWQLPRFPPMLALLQS